MSATEAFPPTAEGQFELKTLPAGILLKSTSAKGYFEASNGLFGPLFRYISSHDIAMTTPVEARINPGTMYFWVAESEQSKVSGSAKEVEVVAQSERLVASIGVRGSYSEENFNRARDQLEAWLGQQADVAAIGPAYAVYWHGPFRPWFTKHSEVHIPIRRLTR
ncbi:MAG: heme-binding protein [Cephaloticoccus sp.]|nr:heme-binding protein [Cephaloticoccus sp.]MCF7761619.1 heme-binding protein [Cephaloticoccus sp.]